MFCVQPYSIKRHKLVAAGAMVFKDGDTAIAAGRRLARARAGIVVLSQDFDARLGRLGPPRVMAIHGQVPPSWRQLTPLLDVA